MIQVAEIGPLTPGSRESRIEPYFAPAEELHLTHSERTRLYTSGWFDLACFSILLILAYVALFV